MRHRPRVLRFVLTASLLGIFIPSARGSAWAPSPADLTRALSLAQSGIASAEARLKAVFPSRSFDPAPWPYRFWGGDQTETVEPPAGALLEDAVNPSFAIELDGDPAGGSPVPKPIRIGGASRGVSGVSGPGTYASNGDHFALKVSDLSGRIYVNDGVDAGPGGSVSQNLKRILNALGQIVGEPNLGDRIVQNRPAGGYAALRDLVPALGGEASFQKVKDFLTAHAWVDRNVANPVPLSSVAAARSPVQYDRGSPALYRFGTSLDAGGQPVAPNGLYDTYPNVGNPTAIAVPEVSIFGLDTLNAQWVEIVGRAPININTARREVLVALLSDLKGFYISERKRNNARWQGDILISVKLQNSFAPAGTSGSEYGYLMETYPIASPAGGTGISPYEIADEILACRNRKTGKYANYAAKPWGGPFRNWSQFNVFIDSLVAAGLLNDPRPIHKCYEEDGVDPVGFGNLVPDPVAQMQAAKAIADVLKANFNPNLHLNELNPDENLHLLVDKTDLVVNSTEFCFVPTGHFEVESLGRVVQPTDGAADAFAAADTRLMAQAKVTAVLRLYDLYRETSQKHFYAGTVAPQHSAFGTSSGGTMEIGPEPDNGVFPGNLGAGGAPDNEWDGYLSLPTVGGLWHGGAPKAKNTLATTLSYGPTPHLGAAMHAHFTLDGDCCDHPFDRREIAGRVLPEEEVSNHPDLIPGVGFVAYGGPYDPTKGNHRLARSFRKSGAAPASLAPFAPSDLRVDGLYAERHSAPAYFMHQGANHFWNWNTDNAQGMVSLWMKPSYAPELTGKIRKFWDMSRYHDSCGEMINTSPFALIFMPVQYNPAISESGSGPQFWHNNMGKFEPCSMYFGSKQWHGDSGQVGSPGHQFGKITRCLNHLGHAGEVGKPSPLRAHRWMNTTFSWALDGTSDLTGNRSQLMINGTQAYTPFSSSTMTGWPEGYNRMLGFDKHCGGAYNHMRIGGTSRIADAAMTGVSVNGSYRANYSSDATIDELYVWKGATDAAPDLLWAFGRYYNVKREPSSRGTFTSQAVSLPPAAGGSVKILGASWTWYGEETDPLTGDRVLNNYGGNGLGIANGDLQPYVRLSVQDGASLYGPLSNDGFSPVLNVAGQTPVIQNTSAVKYLIDIGFSGGTSTSILLASPVLDDVTVYWSNGASTTRIDASTPLVISDPASAVLPDGEYGTPYTATFTASGAAPVTWTVTGGAIPAGLALDPVTGVLSGSPAQGGTSTFVVTATAGTDAAGAQYTLTVTGAPANGGGKKGGGCGLLGAEAALLLLLIRSRGHGARKAARL